MRKGLDRMMQLYVNVGTGDDAVASPNGSLVYKFTTLANERQRADDLAEIKGCKQGEGHITIFELETSDVLNKLECPL